MNVWREGSDSAAAGTLLDYAKIIWFSPVDRSSSSPLCVRRPLSNEEKTAPLFIFSLFLFSLFFIFKMFI